jgi:4,5-DOPA dioxygenase extradiol
MTIHSFNQSMHRLPNSDRMPVLFLGHGSPMNAIEENQFVQGFRNIATNLPKPNAIICISAHWYTNGTFVTAMENPPTIHDFGGFPKELYDVQYPAKGSPDLAQETKQIITKASVALDTVWGLDHGAWSVIKHLYPNADVPVIQLSIDYSKPPQFHYELAKELDALRNKGVLIVGSGNIIHNLRMVDFANLDKDNYGYDWAIEARTVLNNAIINNDIATLLNYQKTGTAIRNAIPTPEHFLPLLYTLGLKSKNEEIELFNDKLLGGSLSMTSLKIA